MGLRPSTFHAGLWPWGRDEWSSLLLPEVCSDLNHYFQSLTPTSELIYPRNIPSGARTEVPRPARFGLVDSEELSLATPDGETLSAFLIKPENKSHARNITVMMFHGNAGNIGHRLPIARVLANDLSCNVLMLQYRGYGLSTGNPNEEGITIDAQTGLDYIRQREDLKNTRIVLYGQSLGGAVSIKLAANNQDKTDIAGMVLENTFLSIQKMIPRFVSSKTLHRFSVVCR